jgi:hypothetical protein
MLSESTWKLTFYREGEITAQSLVTLENGEWTTKDGIKKTNIFLTAIGIEGLDNDIYESHPALFRQVSFEGTSEAMVETIQVTSYDLFDENEDLIGCLNLIED